MYYVKTLKILKYRPGDYNMKENNSDGCPKKLERHKEKGDAHLTSIITGIIKHNEACVPCYI